ncbi:MAG: bifunctional (p)ppGpp synthetase/guanosine-3',5'-bis(diphosphate) 3'-pyrophosphohydrolase [Proteobacteria bacterium]|nr:bifunctional (p)ppGpp synthetase/guanosine-3',5'-bis(diphosphate) 3'-pyrophosphohydrolase [Pseudomonadota bacterium]
MNLQTLINTVQSYLNNADIELIRKAYSYVIEKHQGQTRASGEPYISHVQEVAMLVAKLNLDVASVATALLHDTLEDTESSINELSLEFGKEIAELVDGVTKLSQVNFSSRAEQQAENFRKMLLAMAKDIRVLLIKLCDRLHNMRTLEFLSESRRIRIAQETLDIYAPLSHRLGIYWMKSELEDQCLRFLKPAIYENIKRYISESKLARETYIKEVSELITRELEQNNVQGNVYGRPKHFYSIYEKMERDNVNFNEIYDLTAFRIIVPTIMDCYSTLGLIHSAWKPIPGRFKDYIAMPKPNNYQSLHTTLIGPKGMRIEIQIRTQEMHEVAEKGIAAHWVYKNTTDGKTAVPKESFKFTWLRDLIESEKASKDPIEFLTNVKDNLFSHEVYVFSPKGDLIALAQGATPIDFAYHIHSELGHRCSGARVNGLQVPLTYKLQNGDTVEVSTNNLHIPNKDWLNIVATNKAKQRIRMFLRAQEIERSISIGKELLHKDLRSIKMNLATLTKNGAIKKASEDLGYKDLDILYADISYGKIATKQIISLIMPESSVEIEKKLENKPESNFQKIFENAAKISRDTSGIKISGFDNMVFRFAKCCQPLPGDELMGYVTRGRGVAIHSRDCKQVLSFDSNRLIPVNWDESKTTVRPAKIDVYFADRIGILANITQKISDAGAQIVSVKGDSTIAGKAFASFQLNVSSSTQLNKMIRELEKVDGITRIDKNK